MKIDNDKQQHSTIIVWCTLLISTFTVLLYLIVHNHDYFFESKTFFCQTEFSPKPTVPKSTIKHTSQQAFLDEKDTVQKEKITIPPNFFKKKGAHQEDNLPKKKTLTVTDIANGFLSWTKENGSTKPDTSIVKTKNELIMNCYCEKIFSALQQSYAFHRHKIAHYQSLPQTGINVIMELSRKGHITELFVVQSCGDPVLDQFALTIFHDAEGEYPPLPSTIPGDTHKFLYENVFSFFQRNLSRKKSGIIKNL